MSKTPSGYHYVIVETYFQVKSGKSTHVHVRPIEGQIFSVDLDVECSRDMRKNHKIGTKFRILAKETNREGGGKYLYSHHNWSYEVVE